VTAPRAGVPVVVACLAAAALAMAPAPASASRSNPLRLRVTPLVGTPDTIFRVGLYAPLRLYSPPPPDRGNGSYRTVSVDAAAAPGRDCQWSLTASSERARKGERLRLTLAPEPGPSPALPLCPGLWEGTVSIASGISCDPTAGLPCPASPEFSARIARFAFVVSGS
jgi:hypothetical protein